MGSVTHEWVAKARGNPSVQRGDSGGNPGGIEGNPLFQGLWGLKRAASLGGNPTRKLHLFKIRKGDVTTGRSFPRGICLWPSL